MSATLILTIIVLYFGVLFAIGYITSRNADNDSFYLGNRKSPWYVVAFGMIGASLSGITFISVPGWVEGGQFGYMQIVFGYLVGYVIIAYILMPIYYKLQLTSIYTYLRDRFGPNTYKTGAVFFLLSRTLGASIRLLLVANVLQYLIFDAWNVPFWVTVAVSILAIWIYTNKGGIKTIIWTDTLQTFFMLLSMGLTIYLISDALNLDESGGVMQFVFESEHSKIFFTDDFIEKGHFLKAFIGGIFIAVGMTGLDQDMMQKNLSCKNIGEAQKNMMSFGFVLVFVNFLFLSLGILLFTYAKQFGIDVPVVDDKTRTDLLFSAVAMDGSMSIVVGVLFILGLIAAAYSSADSALTSLTTSVSIDFLDIENKAPEEQKRLKTTVHIAMSVALLFVILILKASLEESAIWMVIKIAGFTYGPLIAMYAFGIFVKSRMLADSKVPIVCSLGVLITILLNFMSGNGFEFLDLHWSLGGYNIGAELIFLNACVTFCMLFVISSKKVKA